MTKQDTTTARRTFTNQWGMPLTTFALGEIEAFLTDVGETMADRETLWKAGPAPDGLSDWAHSDWAYAWGDAAEIHERVMEIRVLDGEEFLPDDHPDVEALAAMAAERGHGEIWALVRPKRKRVKWNTDEFEWLSLDMQAIACAARQSDKTLLARRDALTARIDELYWLDRVSKAACYGSDDEFLELTCRAAIKNGCSPEDVAFYSGGWGTPAAADPNEEANA